MVWIIISERVLQVRIVRFVSSLLSCGSRDDLRFESFAFEITARDADMVLRISDDTHLDIPKSLRSLTFTCGTPGDHVVIRRFVEYFVHPTFEIILVAQRTSAGVPRQCV